MVATRGSYRRGGLGPGHPMRSRLDGRLPLPVRSGACARVCCVSLEGMKTWALRSPPSWGVAREAAVPGFLGAAMTSEDGSIDGEPSPRLPDEDRSAPDSRRGVEVAKAIEALGRALGRVSLSGQQGEACFTIEPAELTLQVAVFRTGLAGIEWLVLGPGDDEPPHASAMQMLKIRLAPLLGTGGHALAKTGQDLPDVVEEVSAAGSGEFNWDYTRLDDGKLDKVLASTAPPQSVEFVRLRLYEFTAQFPQPDTAALSGRSRPVMQLIVERGSFNLPTRSKIAEVIRDKEAETMAQYIANQLDTMVSRQLLNWWRTEDPGGFAADADWVEKFQGSLHQYLVGTPVRKFA